MCKKQVALTVLSCAAICAALFGEAQAQLVKLPAVPFTVADCHPGDHWGSSPSHGGLLRCLTNNPPPAPTCPAGSSCVERGGMEPAGVRGNSAACSTVTAARSRGCGNGHHQQLRNPWGLQYIC
jgi:hypothetical protein